MEPTKPRQLLVVAIVCAALGWLVVAVTFTSLAPLPWTLVPALLLCAVAELITGRNLRARIRGVPGAKPVQPMIVPRFVALAKASSLAGAVFAGLSAGVAGYAAQSLSKPVPRHDAITSAITLVASIALVVAAIYLERSCRAPKPPRDDDHPPADGKAGRGGQRGQ